MACSHHSVQGRREPKKRYRAGAGPRWLSQCTQYTPRANRRMLQAAKPFRAIAFCFETKLSEKCPNENDRNNRAPNWVTKRACPSTRGRTGCIAQRHNYGQLGNRCPLGITGLNSRSRGRQVRYQDREGPDPGHRGLWRQDFRWTGSTLRPQAQTRLATMLSGASWLRGRNPALRRPALCPSATSPIRMRLPCPSRPGPIALFSIRVRIRQGAPCNGRGQDQLEPDRNNFATVAVIDTAKSPERVPGNPWSHLARRVKGGWLLNVVGRRADSQRPAGWYRRSGRLMARLPNFCIVSTASCGVLGTGNQR